MAVHNQNLRVASLRMVKIAAVRLSLSEPVWIDAHTSEGRQAAALGVSVCVERLPCLI